MKDGYDYIRFKEEEFDCNVFLRSNKYYSILEDMRKMRGKEKRGYWYVKRLFDIVASAVALLLLSPLFVIVSAVIFLDDPHGGPFYSQMRIGRHGKPFRMYKFRSMVVNADALLEKLKAQNEKDGPMFKIKNDPRITKVGRFIRRTSIDELPQLWNVLRGDMSFVGPRPSLPAEVNRFTSWQLQRLMVTPGLTCIWQVMPNRDDISFEEWIDMDIQYVCNRSWLLDIQLILKTFGAVFRAEGT